MSKRKPEKLALILVIALITAGAFPTVAFANSGPIDDDGMPGAEGMVIDEDCPITVLHEDLTFDYRGHDRYSDINGMVTAAYTMQNPTKEEQNVKMAFPYICRRIDLNVSDIGISVDGEFVPWALYAAPLPVESSQYATHQQSMAAAADTMLNFASVLQLVGNGAAAAYDKMNSQQGVLYEITGVPDRFHIVFSDGNITASRHYMTQGNYYYQDGKYRLDPVNGTIRFLSTDRQLHFDIEPNGETSSHITPDYHVSETAMSFGEFWNVYAAPILWTSQGQKIEGAKAYWQNYYAEKYGMQNLVDRGDGGISESDREPMLILMVYEVAFPADSTKEVTVSYPSVLYKESILGQEYFTENYLLNPAGHWAQFGGLTVTVYPPVYAERISRSNMWFTKTGDGGYVAKRDSLPNKDLEFTMRARGLGGFTVFVLVVGVFICGVLGASFMARRRREGS